MSERSPKELREIAVDVATRAAERVRQSAGSVSAYRTKSTPTDVVTSVDIATERFVREELERLVSGSSIAGEELDDVDGDSSVGWVVDPIDGTVNYLYGLPIVAVSIGATIYDVPVAGAVVDVFLNETFAAAAGEGATLDGNPISASTETDLSQALLATGFSYDAADRVIQAKRLTSIVGEVRSLRCLGSALHLCDVASGRLDAYFETGLGRWDYVAGALVAQEAGAMVELPTQDNGNLLVAAAAGINAALRSTIATAT